MRIYRDYMKELIVILILLLFFTIVYTFTQNIIMLPETKIERNYTTMFEPVQMVYANETRATTINVPAVDREGKGVMASLSVEVIPGVGRTLVDINQIFFWVDTQDSIRTAKVVAKNITGLDLSKYDTIYSIRANASVIEGPSAGAAMAITTILELEDRTINDKVTITGTLDEEGGIGKVSGITAKAEAVKNSNMSLLLVPKGQKTYTTYSEKKSCEQYVLTVICRTETKPEEVDVEKKVGIRIEEVSNVREALKYFLI